jgi:predicted SAM-dependent methyltransferase
MTAEPSPAFDPAAHPRRLNLGCGWDHRDGYVNVDFLDFHHPDVVADVRDLVAFPSGYYDEVLAVDVLEHLHRGDVKPALAEWGRVLRAGGRLVIRVPDVVGLVSLMSVTDDLEQQETLLQCMYGTQAYDGDFHHFGFTEVVLRNYLYEAGFGDVRVTHRDHWLFDVDAVKVEHPGPLVLGPLPFMVPGGDLPPGVQPRLPGGAATPTGTDALAATLRRAVASLRRRVRGVVDAQRSRTSR